MVKRFTKQPTRLDQTTLTILLRDCQIQMDGIGACDVCEETPSRHQMLRKRIAKGRHAQYLLYLCEDCAREQGLMW